MTTLKRTSGSTLFEAYCTTPQDSRFCWWPAQSIDNAPLALSQAWTKEGVFIIAAEDEETVGLERFGVAMWGKHGGVGRRVIAWKKGLELDPLFLVFDSNGVFHSGTSAKGLLEFTLGSSGSDTQGFKMALEENASFSADVDPKTGNSLRMLLTGPKLPFRLMLGRMDLIFAVQQADDGAKVICSIAVDDLKPGSGSWEFKCAETSTVEFLTRATPMVKFSEGSASFQKFSVIDIDGSRAQLAKCPLAFRFHPYVARATHTSIGFAAKHLSLISNFIDTAGRQVGLITSENSGLQLQANVAGSGPRFHLTPVGQFGVVFNTTASARVKNATVSVMEMLVGTAGTEFIQLGDGSSQHLPDSLLFVPDSPAFVIRKASGVVELTERVTTSWVAPIHSAKSGSEFPFVAQAEEAPLFAIKPRIGLRNAFTGLREVPGMPFEPAPTSVGSLTQAIAMPMLPIRGASVGAIDAARRLNTRALVPRRRAIAACNRFLAQMPVLVTALEEKLRWVVMPQGFSVALDTSNRWCKVMFAAAAGDVRAEVTLLRPEVNGDPVERWPVEESLSRPATFLVATRFPDRMPDAQGNGPATPVQAHVSVGGWTIDIEIGAKSLVAAAIQEPPILVVKMGGGSKFIDLMKDATQWSLGPVFNEDIAATQRALTRTVTNIETLANGQSPLHNGATLSDETKAAYKLLHDRLLDPDWNGVILLNGTNDPNELPADVAALRAGFDVKEQKLWAPCMGLDLCKVDEAPRVSKSQRTPATPSQVPSIFGGIHFFNPDELDVKELSFALKLRHLDVVLHNSSLRLFVAKADLRVSALLGAEANEAGKNRIVQISGSYQGRSAQGKDVYLIQAIGTQKIGMQSDVIESIELNRLELTSRLDGDKTLGRFGLWGSIGFGKSVTELTGLKTVRFDSLAISVVLEPGKDTKFSFDAGHLDVDWQRPSGGKAGWLDSFPMTLGGIRWGGGDFSLPVSDWPDLPRLELPDLGFSGLDLGDFPIDFGSLGTSLDFGLELNLDMGSFGAMTDAAKLFKAKIIFGWHDFRRYLDGGSPNLPKFAIGFKFEGGAGPLDIGIQGVLRLKAKKAILKRFGQAGVGKSDLLGIALDEPQLDMLGYKVPDKPADLRVAVVVELGDSSSKNNLPTWVFAKKNIDAGPVDLKYFSIGQNVLLLNPAAAPSITSVTDAVEKSVKWMDDKFADEQLYQLRPDSPSGKWNLVADGLVRNNIADVKLVFLDDVPLYGLRVKVPIDTPLFEVDILYKKIAEDLGVFSLELDLKGLRTIELGAGSLTLPVLTFRKFTKPNWDIDFGFRYNDFSAAATLQVLPFLGSGSMRFGQLSGQSGNFLLAGASGAMREYYRKDLALEPVYEIQLAFRVGIGKEIRQGIFSAGASLSVYGLFQGALGTITKAPAEGHRYVKLAGAAGILLEVFGEVNFAVVSAAVYIRLWVENGMVLETWQPIAIYAEAGVSVYVRFVIARIRIWTETIEIAVNFSFTTTLRVGATLPVVLDHPPLIVPKQGAYPLLSTQVQGTCPAPINWVAQNVGKTLDVVLAVQFDAQAGDDKVPVLVPMLALIDSHPQGRASIDVDATSELVTRVLRWAVRLSMGNPDWITADDLRTLLARLRVPGKRALSRWVPTAADGSAGAPLDHNVIRKFFAQNFQFKLRDPEAAQAELRLMGAHSATLTGNESLPGIVMPWLRELEIFAGVPERSLRDFTSETYKVDEGWELRLRDQLAQGRPRLDSLDPCQSPALASGGLNQVLDVTKKALLDILLEDWFACLVEAGAYSAMQIVDAAPDHRMRYHSLEETFGTSAGGGASPATVVAQQASAVLLHAMRVPDSTGAWMGLLKRAGLELRMPEDVKDTDAVLTVRPNTTATWIEQEVVKLAFAGDAAQARKRIAGVAAAVFANPVTLKVEAILDEREHTATVTHGTPIFTQDGVARAGTMFQLPDDVVSRLAKLRQSGKVPTGSLPVKLKGFGEFKEGAKLEASRKDDVAGKVRVGGFIKLALRRVEVAAGGASGPSGARTMRGVYGVNGGGEAARLVLKSWNAALARLQPDAFTLVWNPSSGKVPKDSIDSVTRTIATGARFFATNLSTETNPELRVLADSGRGVVVADLTDPSDVREFLWKTALVNADGFYLALDESNAAAIDVIEAQLDAGVPAEIAVAWSRPAFTQVPSELHPLETHLFVAPNVAGDNLTVTLDLGGKLKGTGVPEGYVKLRISKPNPMLAASFADDEQKEFFARYAFVEYSVDGSKLGRPTFVSLSADECTPLPLEAPENDVNLKFEAQEPFDLEHVALIPLLNFARSNRDSTGLLLKDPDALNPYALVGEDIAAVMKFGLRDAAGHRYPGELNIKFPETKVVYRDPLFALGAYPGVALDWDIAPGAGHGKVVITLRRSDLKRALSVDEAAATRKQFQRLAWMLDAPGISATARVTVGGRQLEANVLKELREFVKKILASTVGVGPADKEIEIQVSIAELEREVNAAGGVKQLRVDVELARLDGYFDKDLAEADPAMKSIISEVLPAVDPKVSSAWPRFANKFERAFAPGNAPRPVYFLKLAGASGGEGCWIVSGDALRRCLDAPRTMASFAPLPLSRNLMSGDARLLDTSGSLPPSELLKTISDIDLDLLASRCFEFIENVLAPAASARMCAVSRPSFSSIMDSKAKIVGIYEDRLWRIESASGEKKAGPHVKARFTAAAAANLRRIYELGAICSISADPPLDTGAPESHRVYGTAAVIDPESPQSFELSSMRFDLSGKGAAALSVYWKGARKADSVRGKGLRFEPRYLECQWPGETGEIIPSRWFELLSFELSNPDAPPMKPVIRNNFVVPLPLRVLPATPNVFGHRSRETHTTPASLQQARRWNYTLDTAAPGEDQDRVTYTVRYEPPPTFNVLTRERRTAFDALVTFQHYASSLADDLSTVLAWKEGADPAAARMASERLKRFIADVADHLGSLAAEAPEALTAEPHVDEFVSTLRQTVYSANFDVEGGANQHEIEIECQRVAGNVPGREVSVTLKDVTVSPPAHVQPSGQEATIVAPAPSKKAKSTFVGADRAVKGATGLVGRSLELRSLDVFQHATATPLIRATRNEKLGGLDISPEFIFSTAAVKAERLVPRLKFKSVPFTQAGKKMLSTHIAAVARELFDGASHALSVDALATLRVPFGDNHVDTNFGYPLGAMKGVTAKSGEWEETFRQWGTRLELELAAKSVRAKPMGIDLSLTVYAEGYAGSKPVMVIERITIPWSDVLLGRPSIGFVPPKVERAVDLAGILFALTRGIEMGDPASTAAAQDLRGPIARLLRARVPTLNYVEKAEFPCGSQLRDPATAMAWAQCIEAALSVFDDPSDGAVLPMAWALEPSSLEGTARPLALQATVELANSRGIKLSIESGEALMLRRTQPDDIYEGSVKLVSLVANQPTKKVKSARTRRKQD